MDDTGFNPPRLAINRVYTRRGDGGETALAGGQKVAKDSSRIHAYGTVDELNACAGLARATAGEVAASSPRLAGLCDILLRVQHELFNLGSILATLPDDVQPRQPRVTAAEIAQLESEMDRMNEELPELRSFVLPGGSRLNAELHLCRTVCRRAERKAVQLAREETVSPQVLAYLNRLSDLLFVLARAANLRAGGREIPWVAPKP